MKKSGIKLKDPEDVCKYIEYLLQRVPEENASGIAALLKVWLKARFALVEIDSIRARLTALEQSIKEHQAAFMEETEEMMGEVESDLKGSGR